MGPNYSTITTPLILVHLLKDLSLRGGRVGRGGMRQGRRRLFAVQMVLIGAEVFDLTA